jgi:hypothetical protein
MESNIIFFLNKIKMNHITNGNIDNLYKQIQTLNAESMFKYSIILMSSILFFRNLEIGLNIFMGLIVGLVIIIYIYQRSKLEENTEIELLNEKEKNIFPPLSEESRQKKDIIELLFTIQEYYTYNPQSYEEMIDNINSFMTLYNDVLNGVRNCSENYHIAESKMHNAINALHSIIYKLPASDELMKKFNKAHNRLMKLMNNYLEEMFEKCQEKIIRKGYNNKTKIIDKGPKPFNFYLQDKSFTYDFY